MAEGRFAHGQGLGLRRLDLHAALRDRAHALGVETVQSRVEDLQQDADGVCAAGLRAPYLVAADGLRSPLRAALGLDLPPRRPPRVGLRRHFRVPPRAPFVEVHCSPLAEAYITPVGPDRVGLAFLMRQGQGPRPQGGRPPTPLNCLKRPGPQALWPQDPGTRTHVCIYKLSYVYVYLDLFRCF